MANLILVFGEAKFKIWKKQNSPSIESTFLYIGWEAGSSARRANPQWKYMSGFSTINTYDKVA